MDWPAQSTDLNPIKLWDQIKTMVREQNPTSVKELWTAINSAWEGFPSDGLNNLIVSISRMCTKESLLNIKTFLLCLFCGFGLILVNIVLCTTSEQFFLTARFLKLILFTVMCII